jgi:hypothetical protein
VDFSGQNSLLENLLPKFSKKLGIVCSVDKGANMDAQASSEEGIIDMILYPSTPNYFDSEDSDEEMEKDP